MNYFIGLLSGTSVDGIDAALVAIDDSNIKLICSYENKFSQQLQFDLQQIIKSKSVNLNNLSNIDAQLALEFSSAVNKLVEKSNIKKQDIIAIGSHGQTIFHQPDGKLRNTMQIGSPHILAANTNIDVVCNFRNLDMAFSGQGAPLAPLIHKKLFSNSKLNLAIINLGGIANVSFIGKDYPKPIGYDIGPANCLLDEWIFKYKKLDFDENGSWAKHGKLNKLLLDKMLDDNYFKKPYPKSTGREYFNSGWLDQFGEWFKNTASIDVQTTLTHLTAASIAQAIESEEFNIDEIVLMGGGANNSFLQQLIQKYSSIKTTTSKSFGYDSNWIEAILFAYLAYMRINNIKIDLSSFTGSDKKILVGDVVCP